MKIYIDQYLLQMPNVRSLTEAICDDESFARLLPHAPEETSWSLSWGYPVTKRRFAVAETGFFWDAMHIDTQGLYQFSSLNLAKAQNEIENFDCPVPANELVLKSPLPKSKFRQPKKDVKWSGVVFASQNPSDRSVHSVASTEDWWRFYEECCKYYGKQLFVKLHPWNQGEVEAMLRRIAKRWGCTIDRTGHGVLDSCDHVVLFSSTFSVDCMIRGVPVKQGAPGYFSYTGAVTYCAGDPRKEVENTIVAGQRLCDFLVWRYCFSMDCTLLEWKDRLQRFASSTELFPLREAESYGDYLLRKLNTEARPSGENDVQEAIQR
jgi:hypothetical protein